MQTFENILMFKHFYSLIFQFFSLLSPSFSSGFWLLLGLCIERFLGTIKVLVFAVAQTLSISPSSITVIMRSPLYQTGEGIEFLLLAFSSLFFAISHKRVAHTCDHTKRDLILMSDIIASYFIVGFSLFSTKGDKYQISNSASASASMFTITQNPLASATVRKCVFTIRLHRHNEYFGWFKKNRIIPPDLRRWKIKRRNTAKFHF